MAAVGAAASPFMLASAGSSGLLSGNQNHVHMSGTAIGAVQPPGQQYPHPPPHHLGSSELSSLAISPAGSFPGFTASGALDHPHPSHPPQQQQTGGGTGTTVLAGVTGGGPAALSLVDSSVGGASGTVLGPMGAATPQQQQHQQHLSSAGGSWAAQSQQMLQQHQQQMLQQQHPSQSTLLATGAASSLSGAASATSPSRLPSPHQRGPAQIVSEWMSINSYHNVIRRDELRMIEEIGRGEECSRSSGEGIQGKGEQAASGPSLPPQVPGAGQCLQGLVASPLTLPCPPPISTLRCRGQRLQGPVASPITLPYPYPQVPRAVSSGADGITSMSLSKRCTLRAHRSPAWPPSPTILPIQVGCG